VSDDTKREFDRSKEISIEMVSKRGIREGPSCDIHAANQGLNSSKRLERRMRGHRKKTTGVRAGGRSEQQGKELQRVEKVERRPWKRTN
jgi:hypothetical protein